MFYQANLTISDEELSVIQIALDWYVEKHTGSHVGVEFERELAHKVKVILDVKRVKNKKASNTDML